jgi:hypothetical protein
MRPGSRRQGGALRVGQQSFLRPLQHGPILFTPEKRGNGMTLEIFLILALIVAMVAAAVSVRVIR